MNEVDDRLAGDPVWELFPYPSPAAANGSRRTDDYRRWLAWSVVVVVCWFLFRPFSVVAACLAFASHDFREGLRLARAIPDKAGGAICSRFAYAWGAWKLGLGAFVLMLIVITVSAASKDDLRVLAPELATTMLLWTSGFTASAALTVSGLIKAYQTGMKVWIGEGVNQARTLLTAMLIVGFAFFVLIPLCVWLAAITPLKAEGGPVRAIAFVLGLFGCMFGGPLVIVIVLDRLSRRVVAERPGKFGPKVPTVGKWNS